MNEQPVGTVYLYHFDRPYRHAMHYLGWSEDLPARDAAHRNGSGARLLQVLNAHGIGYALVREWPNTTRAEERRLKKFKGATRLCPHEDCKELRRQRSKRWPKIYKPRRRSAPSDRSEPGEDKSTATSQ